ncbi:MAG: hypothetical protein D6798_05065 [Deltaproteobacteria bacterium]|nr:MAG: hypothetical protein D6798_05065 [Deltaproteobacteria bacterium]
MPRARCPLEAAIPFVPLLLAALPAAAADTPHPPTPVSLPAAAGAVAPGLSQDGDGLLLTWWEPAGEGSVLRLARFDGTTMSAAMTVSAPAAPVVNWADTPQVARSGDGSLVAWWPQQAGESPDAYEVALARSTDEGASWTDLGVVHDDGTDTEHGFVSMAPEGQGLRVAWLDGRAMVDQGPMQLRTTWIGHAIGPAQVVDPRTCDCCGTALVPTPAGPVVVYRDRSDNETRDIFASVRQAEGWSTPRSVSDDGWQIAGCPVNGPRAALTGAHLAVTWTTGVAGPRVRAAFSDASTPTLFSPAVELDGPDDRGEPLGRVYVTALDDAGLADTVAVSWLRQEDGLGRVQLATLRADGQRSDAITVGETTADRKAGFPRLGRAGDSILVVWTDPRRVDSLQAVRLAVSDLPVPSEPARSVVTTDGGAAPAAAAAVAALPDKFKPVLPADYRAPDLAGVEHGLAPERPGLTMVNFFASWCPPCMAELPVIAELVQRHPDLHLVSIATDDMPAKVKALVAQGRLSGQVLLDSARNVTPAFGATELPTTLLYDASGTLIWAHEGPLTADEPELEALLAGG